MTDISVLARLLENIVRLGVIIDVQPMPPRVKVRTGRLTTTWLPWLTLRAGDTLVWDPPSIDEQVLLLSPSGQLANGVVLTGLFSDTHPANGNRPGLHRRTYTDGAVVEYDSIAHHLAATLPAAGTLTLHAPGGLHIVGPITHEGNYSQTGDQHVSGTITATVNVVAADVSLVKHIHGGVMPGPGQSGAPT